MRVAVLTVSDGCYHGTREDKSGELIVRWCSDRGYELADRTVVPDDRHRIAPVLMRWADDDEADLIVTTGGTGFTPRDVTPEATRAVLDREAPGVAETIRRVGGAKTAHAMLSRGLAGTRLRTMIVNLPGSPGGVADGLEVLDGVVDHAVALLRDRQSSHLADGAAHG